MGRLNLSYVDALGKCAIDRTLANNTRLVMEPVAASNSAAIGFWFPVGSRDEPDGFQGATHFIEHLLFKGTRTRTSRDIALFFDRVGGYINAFTEREVMCVMCGTARHGNPRRRSHY